MSSYQAQSGHPNDNSLILLRYNSFLLDKRRTKKKKIPAIRYNAQTPRDPHSQATPRGLDDKKRSSSSSLCDDIRNKSKFASFGHVCKDERRRKRDRTLWVQGIRALVVSLNWDARTTGGGCVCVNLKSRNRPICVHLGLAVRC